MKILRNILIDYEVSRMKCPCCNKEMEKGELRSRGGVFFLSEGEELPIPVKMFLYWKKSRNKLLFGRVKNDCFAIRILIFLISLRYKK